MNRAFLERALAQGREAPLPSAAVRPSGTGWPAPSVWVVVCSLTLALAGRARRAAPGGADASATPKRAAARLAAPSRRFGAAASRQPVMRGPPAPRPPPRPRGSAPRPPRTTAAR